MADAQQGIRAGDTIENPALGLRSVVLEASPDLLRSEAQADAGGNGGPLHRHMRQEELFLLQRYPEDFFYAPVVPPGLQRALARPLARRAGRR